MGWPSFSPPHNEEVPIILLDWKLDFRFWLCLFINVKIQWKSYINQNTKQSIERLKHFGGGGERMGRPSLSPPHKVEVPINQLTCWFKNLISLWNRSFKIVQIQSKSKIKRKTKQWIEKFWRGVKNEIGTFWRGERLGWPSHSHLDNAKVPINLLVWKLDSLFGTGHTLVLRCNERAA